jgi:hypothetical protein
MRHPFTIRGDDLGQGVFTLIPFILGFALVVGGAFLITSASWSAGLILVGIGVLLLGAGGSGTLGYGVLKVAGPTGLIIIVFGAIVRLSLGK